jgi:hypothetical protein
MKKLHSLLLFFTLIILLSACSKGYDVRVTNYYIEQMDTVVVGDKIVFTDVARQTSTEYKNMKKGTYNVTFITKTKVHINSSIVIPSKKSGKRTIQIDGQGNVLVLKD